MSLWQEFFHDLFVPQNPWLNVFEQGDPRNTIAGFLAPSGDPLAITWQFRQAMLTSREYIYEYFAQSPPPYDSPTYSLDTPANLSADGRPIPIVYGVTDWIGGLTLYAGGDSDTRDAFVAFSEGPIHGYTEPKVNGVPVGLIPNTVLRQYLGTASQLPDDRSGTYRHQESPGTQAWNWKTGETTPAVARFQVIERKVEGESGAYVWLKLSVMLALNGPDTKAVRFSVEMRAEGDVSWTAAGNYTVNLSSGLQGPAEVRVPLYVAGNAEARSLTFGTGYVEGPTERVVTVLSGQAGYRETHPAASATILDAGVYYVRVTILEYIWDPDEADGITDAGLTLAAIDVVETTGLLAYRDTAYLAVTVPVSDVARGQSTVTARVAGRNTVDIWDADANDWRQGLTNNPVWCARDLWLSKRYGAGRPAFGDERGKLAAAYCDELIAQLDGGPVVPGQHTTNPAGFTGLWFKDFADVTKRFDGYVAVSDQGERRLVVTSKPQDVAEFTTLDVGAAFTAIPASFVVCDSVEMVVVIPPYGGGEGEAPFEVPQAVGIRDTAFVNPAKSSLTHFSVQMLTSDTTDYTGKVALAPNGEYRTLTGWFHQVDEQRVWIEVDRAWNVKPASVEVWEQRFRFDYVFDSQEEVLDAVKRIAAHCRGVAWVEGDTLSFDVERPRDRAEWQTGVSALTPDVMLEGSFSAERKAPGDAPKGILVKYLEPGQANPKRTYLFPPSCDPSLAKTVDLPGCLNPHQARRLAAYLYNKGQLQHYAAFSTTLAPCALEPGDRVPVAHPVTGWGYQMSDVDAPVRDPDADKDFLVLQVTDNGDADTLTYQVLEYSEAIYTDDVPALTAPVQPTTFANPFAPPAPCASVSAASAGTLTPLGAWDPVVEVGWVHPQSDAVGSFRLYWRPEVPAASPWTLAGSAAAGVRTARVAVLKKSGWYQVVVAPVSVLGVETPWDQNPVARVYAGPPVATAPVAGDLQLAAQWNVVTVTVAATHSRCPTHTGYRFRWTADGGATWTELNPGGADLMTFTVPLALIAAAGLVIGCGAAETNSSGQSEWSDPAEATVYDPTTKLYSGSAAGPFTPTGSTARYATCVTLENVVIPPGAKIDFSAALELASSVAGNGADDAAYGLIVWYSEPDDVLLTHQVWLFSRMGNPPVANTFVNFSGSGVAQEGVDITAGTYDFKLVATCLYTHPSTAKNCSLQMRVHP